MKRRAQPWLGTLVEVSIAGELDDAGFNTAFNAAFAAVARVHRLMSFHDTGSDVSRINRAAPGSTVEVDPTTWEVLDSALAIGRATNGMFDIGCAPVLAGWGYLPPPAEQQPERAAANDMLGLRQSSLVEKRGDGWIDLGGIAKGYAVDAAVAALRGAGIESGCVNAGGDLRVFGAEPFTVAVRDPAQPSAAARQLSLRNEALATSAGYFSRRRIGGRDCSALVDGRNGQPIATGISASVRAPVCMLADALTKAVLASGDAQLPALQHFGARAFLLQ